ncbi:hypothetical protein AWH56_020785 [Anaerobacillus isosaccharinicus]|nr:hypothetical protein [Anaerobacillus isosaccharinicus]MBA5586656.1 hypothetical protein [Anaerobacillus isosaccharinicus]QOY35111.1 hypothetical protein AWH56_020785 [Anaerobacillus isosaccharinicus]
MSDLYVLEVLGENTEGEEISFSYCGIQDGLTYIQPFIQNQLLDSNITVKRRYIIQTFELTTYLAENKDDLIVISTNKEQVYKHFPEDCFIMPFRIHQIVDTSKGIEKVLSSMSKREVKRHSKQKEKYKLDFYTTNEDKHFFDFYNRMHKPTMKSRYDGLARSVEINKAYEEIFKKGLLFIITENGVPVSGSVSQIDEENKVLNARLIGVLNGDDRYRYIGAQNHVYHSILEWACRDHRIDQVDFQGCEPFLTKGTFQYKKRFATEAILPPNHLNDKRLLVKANFNKQGIKDFLFNNPVMLVDKDDKLGVGYFYDVREPRLDIPYHSPGFLFERMIRME